MNLPKVYNPKEVEQKIYQTWLDGNFFEPKINLKKKPFVIAIPPPNVTGSLHMGHALNNTLQDILIRYHRMQGEPVLWIPGTDHAGIATQNVVEKELAKEGKTRDDLGREKFVEKVWEWVDKYGHTIIEQLKSLGCSCDWSRLRFTMDEAYQEAVKEAFVKYYEAGFIYRGTRVVNWCLRCGTTLSDIELEYEEESGQLWYIKYKIKTKDQRSNNQYITVATTRPETMLGDTAVAVNPRDKRYKDLVGKTVILPLVNREIPIIADDSIDTKFGTGAVKVTPAHDALDAEVGLRHKLAAITVIDENGKMTKEAGDEFVGLDVMEARDRVVDLLKELKLIEKIEDFKHNVAHCYRCGTVIEPLVSKQWFVKMKELAKLALGAYEKEIKINPASWKKVAEEWLKNIRDWTISRQIWWGHRLPVYFCKNQQEEIRNQKFEIRNKSQISNLKSQKEEFIIAKEKPKKCPICGNCEMKQSEDVLDTWFSSALWPFATLGWPKETEDLKYFYPTSVNITARDIIHLWVTRMIFSGLYFTGKIPFSQVVINATVLNREGKRMSKSLGTGVDPIDLIEKYGADATRFGLVMQAAKGQDIRFGEDYLLSARNFANKIWNLGRFITMRAKPAVEFKPKTDYQKWMVTKLNELVKETEKTIKNFDFSEYTHALYAFTWDKFASIYVEKIKKETDENSTASLYYIYENILKLLHPVMPHLTEELYGMIWKESLIISAWPEIKFANFSKEEKQVDAEIQELTSERSQKENQAKIESQKKYIAILEKKFANKQFVEKAPKEVVAAERKKLEEAVKELAKLD